MKPVYTDQRLALARKWAARTILAADEPRGSCLGAKHANMARGFARRLETDEYLIVHRWCDADCSPYPMAMRSGSEFRCICGELQRVKPIALTYWDRTALAVELETERGLIESMDATRCQ